jgi:hypothetical protein
MTKPNKIHMQLPAAERDVWPWWLAMAFALALAALWWGTAPDDAAAPAPAARLANRPPGADVPLAVTPSQAAAPKPTPAPAKPSLQLVGTVMAGAGSMAMVRQTADARVLELRVGDRVAGLAVAAIEPDRVVLAGAAQPIVIEAARPAAAPREPSRAASAPSAPAYAEGEAPWDLAPPFRH